MYSFREKGPSSSSQFNNKRKSHHRTLRIEALEQRLALTHADFLPPLAYEAYDTASQVAHVLDSAPSTQVPDVSECRTWDVNKDEHVTPIDALMLINRINAGIQDENGYPTPLSVLQIINALNSGAAQACVFKIWGTCQNLLDLTHEKTKWYPCRMVESWTHRCPPTRLGSTLARIRVKSLQHGFPPAG